ncbi:hypothetical protein M2010_003745 [Providencia stuartii]|uniref:hypothetical protein n=1 Tax=Providencia stuartii TaxID=588 RepID=UPI0012B521BC|nr:MULTISPECIES: hypothetical protein [Providencia]MDT2043762.1 hypothetical protein [Providencia stuartii]MTC12728.1 hypothetical protein [Providencia stuartii]GHC05945.1 hypothetical protein GCM10007290_38500 [Providencia thailandensis]HEM7146754.1 hypothetical protein [Providencia stuartii]
MMTQKWFFLLFVLFFSLLMSGCANVRWKHPTPSREIIQLMMSEIQGARNIDEEEFAVEETLARLKAQKVSHGTRPFQVVLFDKDHEIRVEGYSEYFDSLGIISDADFAHFSIPNKNNIQGYYYSYRGTMKAVDYSLPHMVRDSNSKDSLVLYTKPLTNYQITVIYLEGAQYQFNYGSMPISIGLFGPAKSYKNSFDGRFYISPSDKTNRYQLRSPMY